MSTSPGTVSDPAGELQAKHRLVIIASSLGTVFEWYDFYLYAVLATLVFSGLFFPSNNPVASNLAALATFGAGFGVRPFGALVFGWIGDVVGRKYTFLVTIVVMGLSTALVGLLPTYAPSAGWPGIGIWAPVLLVTLRLAQGLALGGEYGGAATYVAEHAPHGKRGLFTSWIQTTATIGLLLALIVLLLLRKFLLSDADFKTWGWRIPFLLSVILLGISVYIRLKLQESPIFAEIKAQKRTSKWPLLDSFFKMPNARYVWLALLGATAGQGVVWYTGQFQALFFLTNPLKLAWDLAYYLIGFSLLVAFPLFLFFGWLSDRIGRKPIMLGGCLLAAVTYIPLFHALTHYVNPALEEAQQKAPVVLYTNEFSGFGQEALETLQAAFQAYQPTGEAKSSAAVRAFLVQRGVPFEVRPVEANGAATLKVGENSTPVLDINDSDKDAATKKLAAANKTYEGLVQAYPKAANPAAVNWVGAELILIVFIIYVTMVYAPIAAFLVELFPTRIRYTSMSFPYHIGNGWFGGFLPLIVASIIAATGNLYLGLWYPIGVALMTLIIGFLFIRETKDRDIRSETTGAEETVGDGRDPALA